MTLIKTIVLAKVLIPLFALAGLGAWLSYHERRRRQLIRNGPPRTPQARNL